MQPLAAPSLLGLGSPWASAIRLANFLLHAPPAFICKDSPFWCLLILLQTTSPDPQSPPITCWPRKIPPIASARRLRTRSVAGLGTFSVSHTSGALS